MLVYFSYDGDYDGSTFYRMPVPLIINFSFGDDFHLAESEFNHMRNSGFPFSVIKNAINSTLSFKITVDIYHIWGGKSFRKEFDSSKLDMDVLGFEDFLYFIKDYLSVTNEDKQRGCYEILSLLQEKSDLGEFFGGIFRFTGRFIWCKSKRVLGSLEYKGD